MNGALTLAPEALVPTVNEGNIGATSGGRAGAASSTSTPFEKDALLSYRDNDYARLAQQRRAELDTAAGPVKLATNASRLRTASAGTGRLLVPLKAAGYTHASAIYCIIADLS
ncbi:hypothetical protein J2S98_004556 [Arthrobacter oryzae]|uniref:hypothetical protein n=1 Tax=Arthrobacter TaxID=1663 RepID=UPI001F3CBD22|nr:MULTISPECIES: hypothetical protein [Arthrobacter]MDP9989366.1 hypothetical protein [Arthrobacter oryzae]UKA71464.1 hypothetical protein LFT49_01560 [Arthrobacter sp. FW306-06-A]